MQRHFEHELTELRDRLMSMASYAAASVTTAVRALVERDDTLAAKVKVDDAILDRLEMEIDEISIHLLSKAPLARDLRLITIAMKISQNLERIGDEATTIGRRVLLLNEEPQLRSSEDMSSIANQALGMLRAALESFISQNPEQARQIIPQDKPINAFHKALEKELTEWMMRDPAVIRRAMSLIVISKCLERIGDHAKNIAEEVVYLCEAQDIRHQTLPATP